MTKVRTSETIAHTTEERDSTATEKQESGEFGTTIGVDDSETCTITQSHNASCDDGRGTSVDRRRDHTLQILCRCTDVL